MTLEIVANRIAELEKQMTAVLTKLDEKTEAAASETKPKKDKSPKKEKAEKEDKPKKKRGMPAVAAGYLLFSKENRTAVKEELGEVKPTEVVTEVAKRWKALTDDERGEWNKRAKEGEEVEVDVTED